MLITNRTKKLNVSCSGEEEGWRGQWTFHWSTRGDAAAWHPQRHTFSSSSRACWTEHFQHKTACYPHDKKHKYSHYNQFNSAAGHYLQMLWDKDVDGLINLRPTISWKCHPNDQRRHYRRKNKIQFCKTKCAFHTFAQTGVIVRGPHQLSGTENKIDVWTTAKLLSQIVNIPHDCQANFSRKKLYVLNLFSRNVTDGGSFWIIEWIFGVFLSSSHYSLNGWDCWWSLS